MTIIQQHLQLREKPLIKDTDCRNINEYTPFIQTSISKSLTLSRDKASSLYVPLYCIILPWSSQSYDTLALSLGTQTTNSLTAHVNRPLPSRNTISITHRFCKEPSTCYKTQIIISIIIYTVTILIILLVIIASIILLVQSQLIFVNLISDNLSANWI